MRRNKSTFGHKLKKIVRPTKKKFLVLAIILIAAGVIGNMLSGSKRTNNAKAEETDIVTRGDINYEITGSASIEPYERYEIIPKVSGDITYCPYDVGDHVNKNDLLYGFDASDTDLTIERQRISLKQSENSYNDALKERDKLTITADTSGVISDLTIKAGQEIKNGTKIASINDTTLLEIDLPFTQAQINSINVGDIATITSSKHMSSVNGTVTHKSTASYAGSDGSALYNVTIEFANPGSFYDGLIVGGSIGEHISPGSGTIKNSSSGTVSSETDGVVAEIYYKNGDYVAKGAVIATLTSDTITDKINNSSLSYRSAGISMQQTEKTLEDYNITSPINGTVITKNAKAGDTIDRTNSTQTLMVIADLSRLKFNLEIDELDVIKVTEGLPVTVTCDALPDEEYTGVITKVSVEGAAQNGVTTYSAEVVVEQPGNLRPSMNIDASIIIESAENVLMVPTPDITEVGGKSYVFVKDKKADMPDDTSDKDKHSFSMPWSKKQNNDRKPPQGERSNTNGAPPQGKNADNSFDNPGIKQNMQPKAPAEGFVAVEVQTGVANEDYTEIISGLTEDQEIYRRSTVSTNSSGMMGMMGGMGHPGGGMSGGGMSGPPSGGGMR